MDSAAEDFPEGSKGHALAVKLKEELAALSDLDVSKAVSMNKREQGTIGRRDVRLKLRKQVKTLTETAKVMSRERPDVKGIFERTQTDNSDQTLIAVARAFADAAASLAGLFAEYNIPATFFNDMKSNADKLEHYSSLQIEGVRERVNTNASINEARQRLDDLSARLNVVVRNKYDNNPAKLATWESAYHLVTSARAGRKNGNNAPPPAPQQ